MNTIFNTKNDHSFLHWPKLIQSYVSETVKWKFCHAQIHLLKMVVLIVFVFLTKLVEKSRFPLYVIQSSKQVNNNIFEKN